MCAAACRGSIRLLASMVAGFFEFPGLRPRAFSVPSEPEVAENALYYLGELSQTALLPLACLELSRRGFCVK